MSEEENEPTTTPERHATTAYRWETGIINDVKAGSVFMKDGRAYRAVAVNMVRPGKHGSAKYAVKAEELPGGGNVDFNFTSGAKMEIAVGS
ncbi:hypothetical protein OG897_03995 [Streptomyces sp. NBC_00237]|uniref:hypothetical protein n=1 Tax=Streptomyces sp. NBC_00237 TaxID=2975687 RepID=UPI0022540BDE|nr:hypothetical protein [Streptomyces sp. NBC_00237]MCX5200627.1 hypothetical protein [Streptomyces sp. NBC_00237]